MYKKNDMIVLENNQVIYVLNPGDSGTVNFAYDRESKTNMAIYNRKGTGFGSMFSVFFAGSVIIERIFEIPGMGRLSLDALEGRDYTVFLALLALTSLSMLIGGLISDFLYMIIDPRIDFSKK